MGVASIVAVLAPAVETASLISGRAATEAGSTGLVEEGIYIIRPAGELPYVDESGRMSARVAEHISRFGREAVDQAERIEVLGGRTARQIAEQQAIDELGGVRALSNIRNPIGLARTHLMPNQPYFRR